MHRAARSLQAALEIGGFDRLDKGRGDLRQVAGLAGCQRPLGDRGGNRPERGGEVGGAFDRRQREIHGALAARRENPVEAELEGQIAAFERPLDCFLRQRLGLAREQAFGGQGRQIAAAAEASGRVAGLPLFERPPAQPTAM